MNLTTKALPFRTQKGWITALSVTLCLEAAAAGSLGRNGAFHDLPVFLGYTTLTSRPDQLARWDEIEEREPKLGTVLPSITVTDDQQVAHRLGTSGKPVALLLVAGCKPCIAEYLTRWGQLQRQYPEADFFISTSVKDRQGIGDFKRVFGISGRFLTSGDEPLRRELNPYFQPRAYLFDRGDHLVYLQPPTTSMKAGFARIAILLRKHSGQ